MNSNYSMPMNLGNPDEYTIEQFATIIKDLVGKWFNISFLKTNFIDILKDHKQKLFTKIRLLMILNNDDLI
jgi:hypothetical protein